MQVIRLFSQKLLTNQKGMTLIEIILAISITSILLSALTFIFLTTNRTYNTLSHSYNINSVNVMVLEHIKERGVANAISLTLLEEEPQNYLTNNHTNFFKWENNSLYFNNNIVYRTSIKEDVNVYFTNKGNILNIIIMIDNENYITSDIYLHNLNNITIQEEGSAVDGLYTMFEWSIIPNFNYNN